MGKFIKEQLEEIEERAKNSKLMIDKSKLPNQDSYPAMTLAEYNALSVKPKAWIRTDEPGSGYSISYDDLVKTPVTTSLKFSPSDISYESHNVTDEFNDIKDELNKMKENMNRQLNVTMLHGCRNCGASIEVDIDKPVFCCKYCGTSYIIGTVQQHSTY